jgi:DNA-binding HxlR family transcriptional regulator
MDMCHYSRFDSITAYALGRLEDPGAAGNGVAYASGSVSAGQRVEASCLHFASDIDSVSKMPGKSKSKRRSGCPVSISLERFGDRWSLLIIRDLMVRGYRTFKEFQGAGEGIATNILADRLRKLEATGIITAEVEKTDGRRVNYRLTEKGIDLAPVLLELLIWGARHEETGAPCDLIVQMENNREEVLAETARRWRERDLTPLIPKFGAGSMNRNSRKG